MLGECETITANNSKANKGMIFEENVLNKISKYVKKPINPAVKITRSITTKASSKRGSKQNTTYTKKNPRLQGTTKQRNLHVL